MLLMLLMPFIIICFVIYILASLFINSFGFIARVILAILFLLFISFVIKNFFAIVGVLLLIGFAFWIRVHFVQPHMAKHHHDTNTFDGEFEEINKDNK